MKNSKFSFKRAMALVICLCMVVTSLVFAPVVSAETEIANTNTQEFQKFDFDSVNPAKVSNQNKFFSKVTEEDGNVAIKGTNKSKGTVGYYMQLDHTLEVGKKYVVTLDFKGTGRFWVALCNDLIWKDVTGVPDRKGDPYSSPDGYTRYRLEMTNATTKTYNCIVFLAEGNTSVEGTEFWFDNISIKEECEVTVGTADNGTTSADGKTIFYGDTVDLTALPNPAYKFVKWIDDNGAEVSFANPYSFVAKEAFNITPVFEAYEATEYVRDFDNEEYNNMAPIVGNNSASVEYVYNGDIKKTVAKITIKNDNGKIAIPFVPEDGKDYRVKITYLYTKWFCLFYNGAVQGGEGPSGDAGKWLTKDWYYTQSGKDLFYLFTTKLATNAPAGEPCTIFIDSISFIESTKGDLNNDDAMDSLDITLLRKFLMGDNSNDIDLSAANVSQINDDDKTEVDVKDLVALKKKFVSNK